MYEIHLSNQQLVLPISNPWVALSAVLCRLRMDKHTDMTSRQSLLEQLTRKGSVSLTNDAETIEIVRCD